MIVFTATNKETRDVYVGTARESVEEEWADLNAQAENGASGQFFQQLRQQGASSFEVDTWAYGESSSEARESMREAREELGAQPIKSSRTKAVVRKPANERSDSMKALMAVFEEAMTDEGGVDDDEAFEGVASEAGNGENSSTDVSSQEQRSSVSSMAQASSTPAEADKSVPSPAVGLGSESLSQPSVDTDDAKMQARVQAMKAAQAKLLRERAPAPAKRQTAVAAATEVKPAKIASGRTGSSAKEKRIREAIEAERERRENNRQSRGRDEYDEMNAVMARVEMRRLATKRSNAEKTKAEAAKKRKLEREKKAQAAAAALAPSALTVSVPVPSSSAAVASDTVEAVAAAPKEAVKVTRAAAKASVAQLKLAVGRTGSSAKEKRIKEAVEQEKAERLSKRGAQSIAEAEEMSAILARLDDRSRVTDKLKRRR